MPKRSVVIPVFKIIDHCYNCPYLYIYRCEKLKDSVKKAVTSRSIDDRCPFLEKTDG